MFTSKTLFLWLLITSLALSLPSVHAQTTTVTELRHPTHMLAGSTDPALVQATVSYADAKPGYSLVVGIFDLDTKPLKLVPGIAATSPSRCVNQPVLLALCIIKIQTPSGVERLEFKIGGILSEPRGLGTWNLNMTSWLLDANNTVLEKSTSRVAFGITLTGVTLTVKVPAAVIVTVDGVRQTPGPVRVEVSVGDHTLSVLALAQVNDASRLKFDHWDDGLTETNRSVLVRSDRSFEAIYLAQYRLTIAGLQTTGRGAGWYDEGSIAKFSVAATEPMSGILGALGGKLKFQGWYENEKIVTDSTAGSISMNQPHRLTVLWQPDYAMPATILALLGIAIVLALVYFGILRRTSAARPATKPAPLEHKRRGRSIRSPPARRSRSSRRQ